MMKNSKRYSQTRRASLGAIYKDAAPQPQGHEFNDESYNLWGHVRPNVVQYRLSIGITLIGHFYPKENLKFHKKHFIYNDYSPAHSTEDKTGTTTKLITHHAQIILYESYAQVIIYASSMPHFYYAVISIDTSRGIFVLQLTLGAYLDVQLTFNRILICLMVNYFFVKLQSDAITSDHQIPKQTQGDIKRLEIE